MPVSGQAVSASDCTCAVYERNQGATHFGQRCCKNTNTSGLTSGVMLESNAKNQAVHRKDNQMASGQIFGPMALVSLRVIVS